MIAFSVNRSSTTSSLEGESATQVHISVFLGSIALCLGMGCLLFLPLTPPYRQSGTHYIAVLLPLLIAWWGIVTPGVTYWLFQQIVSTNQKDAFAPQVWGATLEHRMEALGLAILQPANHWSTARHQKQYELILHMVLQEEPQEAIPIKTSMDKKHITSVTVYGDQMPCERILVITPETNNTS